MTQQDALVLFSGGQDSTVCLAHALARGQRVETIGFSYGQRHAVELECRLRVREEMARLRPDWGERLGGDHVVDLSALGAVADTALTRERAIEMSASGLPNTFVPGRNLAFLVFAAAVAYRRGVDRLVIGASEADFSGYPDCRADTLKAMETALALGLDRPVVVEAPLMHHDKRAVWALAHDLGGEAFVELVAEWTHTCYLGDRRSRAPWGYGCGACPACELRAQGWNAFRSGARA